MATIATGILVNAYHHKGIHVNKYNRIDIFVYAYHRNGIFVNAHHKISILDNGRHFSIGHFLITVYCRVFIMQSSVRVLYMRKPYITIFFCKYQTNRSPLYINVLPSSTVFLWPMTSQLPSLQRILHMCFVLSMNTVFVRVVLYILSVVHGAV